MHKTIRVARDHDDGHDDDRPVERDVARDARDIARDDRRRGDEYENDGVLRATRHETKEQRLEREVEELLQELRSILPGIQVMFAFLLTVAFSQRFDSLTELQRDVYFLLLLTAGASLILLLAPSSFHRIRFRRRDKEVMIRSANVEVLAALFLISLTIAGVVFLISDVLYETEVAVVVAAVTWLAAASIWWAYPLTRHLRDGD